MPRYSEKLQLPQVLEALEGGARTSIDVHAATGLPIKHCAAWLNELRLMNIAYVVGKIKDPGHTQRPCNEWRLR